MRTTDLQVNRGETPNRAPQYRARPVAAIQSRYRTTPSPSTSQHHTKPADVVAAPRPAPQPVQQATIYQPPQPIVRHIATTPVNRTTNSLPPRLTVAEAKRTAHKGVVDTTKKTLASIPTLPLPRQSKAKAAVHKFKRATPAKKRGYAMMVLATALLLVGVTVNGYSLIQTKKIQAQGAHVDSSGSPDVAGPNGYSEVQPDVKNMQNYEVAPDMPKFIKIKDLGVWARIIRVGVDTNSAIGTPKNVFDTAWYDGSAKPGQTGAAFIDGHVLGPTKGGVFANLKNLKVGAQITVTMGDNTDYHYHVVASEKVDVATLDMTKALKPYASYKEGLNLMTCNGTFIKDKQTFDKRLIVYAVRDK